MRSRSSADELRPVTVVFADIVGSTSLGERLTPAEVKALVGECVTRMSRAVEEYGGTVQAYMGDGICAYFGVPLAHEDDPERAARAGLRILEVMGEYERDIAAAWGIGDFSVRVGINSGQTAVGLVGAADPQAVALGDATNVAARLQAAAAPGTIAVGEAAARRLADRFVFEPMGEIAVKGRNESVSVSRLVGPRAEQAAAGLPLVGREPEIARLDATMADLKAGRGQVLLIVGDPGIGKTRLLTELRALAGDGVTWLEGQCRSYGGLLSWPFIEILRHWLGVEEGDAEVAIRTKIRANVGALVGTGLDDVLPALGRLLRIQLDPELEARVPPTPERRAAEIRRAYVTWLEALAEQRPVVLALEDIHWADESTRELAEQVLELTDRAPVLLVATLNTDTASEGGRFRLRVLADFPHRATELSLPPLPDEAAAQLVSAAFPGLDEAMKRALVERAEGNPLFLEELLRALSDGAGVAPRRPWTVTLDSAEVLPPAVENLLIARIDRLPERPRHLAQAAAVIGRTFPARILERLGDSADVRSDVAVLLRAGIVRELRRYPELEYGFKHGLVQEAALSTLTPARRRELYGRVATAYEAAYGDSLDAHLDRLAHYNAQADNLPKALEYLERGGAQAAALAAAHRAELCWTRALTIARRLGDREAERRLRERLAGIRDTASQGA